MATYVATNVQGFPDASTSFDSILAVHAIFSNSIAEGGMLLSAWSGVSSASARALGAHSSASGTGATPTIAAPTSRGASSETPPPLHRTNSAVPTVSAL